jgi:hypothetical protein
VPRSWHLRTCPAGWQPCGNPTPLPCKHLCAGEDHHCRHRWAGVQAHAYVESMGKTPKDSGGSGRPSPHNSVGSWQNLSNTHGAVLGLTPRKAAKVTIPGLPGARVNLSSSIVTRLCSRSVSPTEESEDYKHLLTHVWAGCSMGLYVAPGPTLALL